MDKDQQEFDLEAFCGMLDMALASDHPTIKTALRNLMTTTTIITSANPGIAVEQGPFKKLVQDVKNLQRKVEELDTRMGYPYMSNEIGDIQLDLQDYNYATTMADDIVTIKI